MIKKFVFPVLATMVSILGFSQSINLADDVFQNGTIYLKTGDSIVCEVKVYKKDTLHDGSTIRYRLDGDEKWRKIERAGVVAVKLGPYKYSKFKYGNMTMLGAIIRDGEKKLYMVSTVQDYGYTMVTDKADYMQHEFFAMVKGKVIRMNKPAFVGSMAINEHEVVVKNLKKVFPGCEAINFSKKDFVARYKNLANYFDIGIQSCGSN